MKAPFSGIGFLGCAPLHLPARESRIQICHLHHVKGHGVPGATVVVVNREKLSPIRNGRWKTPSFLKMGQKQMLRMANANGHSTTRIANPNLLLTPFQRGDVQLSHDVSGKSQIERVAPWCCLQNGLFYEP